MKTVQQVLCELDTEKLNVPFDSSRSKLSDIILDEKQEEQWHEMRWLDFDYEMPEERKLRFSAAKAETAFDECSRRNQLH